MSTSLQHFQKPASAAFDPGPAMLRAEQAAPLGVRDGRAFAPSARPIPMSYAALDLGTNNCRLLIARRTAGGFRVVDAFSRIVRLGEGLAASGGLSEAAMARTIEALRVCAGKIGQRKVVDRPLCRDRGVPARRQLPRLPGAGARRDRHRDRDHLDRRGGAAGRDRLRAAAAPALSLCDRIRYRRRLDRDRLAAPCRSGRAGCAPNCRSSARCRCRSGS